MTSLRVMPPPGKEAGLSSEQQMTLTTACDAACERGATPQTSVPVAALVVGVVA